jgi:hypothetical protein
VEAKDKKATLQLVAGMKGEATHGEARKSEDGLSHHSGSIFKWGLATPSFRLIPRSLLRGASLRTKKDAVPEDDPDFNLISPYVEVSKRKNASAGK